MHRKIALANILVLGLALAGCSGDPNDPRTWAKKLKDLREQKEALDRIANMDTERARVAVPDLIDLYKETKSLDHLQALVRFKDERTKPLFIEALDFTDEDFDKATAAAGVLGEMKATDAVEKLIAAAEHPLPIKSRANSARLAAIRALVKIGDKRAVPALINILNTTADEQDFLLNQKAALGLAEFRDPQSIPVLVRGLFMTGRGTDIFQECRLALVRIGTPAIPALLELFQEKNAEVNKAAVKYNFNPGIVPYKAAYLLGDLRAAEAVPALRAKLQGKAGGPEHSAIIIALGQIGTSDAVDTLVPLAKNKKGEPKLRASASDALYMTGDPRAVPALLEIAEKGYVTVEGEKVSDLRANAAIDFARIAGPEHFETFAALVEKETEAGGAFGDALERLRVAKECAGKLECYGKALGDAAAPRAEKAAFAIGFLGDKKGIPLLLGALKPLTALPQERYPVHQAILFSLTRLGDRSCKECEEKLLAQIERDEKAVRQPGARGLLAETRVALAAIQGREPGARADATVPATATEPSADADKKGKEGKKGRKAKGGKGKKKRG